MHPDDVLQSQLLDQLDVVLEQLLETGLARVDLEDYIEKRLDRVHDEAGA